MNSLPNPHITALNFHAIRLMVHAVRCHDEQMIQNFGLDLELMEKICKLRIEELENLADFRGLIAQIRFDSRAMRLLLRHVHHHMETENTLNRAIRLKARHPMLHALTGLSRREFIHRCQTMKVPTPHRGRIELLNEHEETLIRKTWPKYSDNNDLLASLCDLAEETGISLDRIWLALRDKLQSRTETD